MIKKTKWFVLPLLLLVILASACSSASQSSPTPVPPTSVPLKLAPTKAVEIPGDVEAGKVVYERDCQQCHSTAEGVNQPGPSFYRAGSHMTLAYTKNSIIEPNANNVISSETDKKEESFMNEGYG
jgi:cytochrome c2